MPDLQSNNQQISGSTYKDFLLTKNVENKRNPEYGLKLAQDIEAKYSAGTSNSYTFLRNDRFKTNILWASGKINIKAKFADLLQLNGKINYANINWKAPMLVNRIISGLVGRWMQRLEKIQVTATDPISVEAKKEQYEQAEFVLYNRKQLEQLQNESGVPLIPPDQFVAEDKDDLDEWNMVGNNIPEEIKYETGTNDILDGQGWFDVLKERTLWDSAKCGLVGAYVWMDEYGEIHIEYHKSLNLLYSFSEFDDFRDTAMRGFVKSVKISEIRRRYGKEFGGKLSEEELFQLAQSCQEYQRFDKLTWNYDWLLSYTRPYDEWNLECIYFWIKSVDEDGYVMTVTKQNKSTIIERRQQSPSSIGENQEYIKKDKWNLYKGVYARTPMKMLEWGLDNNMIRPQDPKESGDVEFPVCLYMYQNEDMRNIALPEKIEEPVEQMILARLKIQQIVSTLVPPGAMINVDAMQEVNLGLAADGETPINPQKVYEQTGRLYYRGRDAEGNPIPVPIQELQNSGFLNQLNGLIQLYEYHYKVLKDELGEDPNLITAATQPRVTSDNVQTSQQQAEFATDYMYGAYKYLIQDIAKKVACLLNNSVRFGAKTYRHLLNEADVNNRQFSTKFKLLPDAFEIQRFEAFLNQQLAASPEMGMYIDSAKLIRIAKEDVKLAELYYRNSMKKMRRSLEQQKQKDIENNAMMQQQSAQQAAEQASRLQREKIDAEKEVEEFKALQQMKVELLKGALVIGGKLENPEMPSWLVPVITQLVPNMTIPMSQQNQQMVESIQAQEMQQQQEMEQPEQSMAAEQEQQMQLQ